MLKERFGDRKTSFRYIPRVLERFREIDPDSTLDLVTKDHAFFRAFAAPSASKTALRFCRPVIGMDGTFLIRAQLATLLVAAAKDGNNQLVPLAFGLCESENKDSWKWFCEKLLTHFPLWPATHDASLISDRDKGLIPAVKEVFPSQFPHYFCSWHLEQNVLKFGPNASELFKKLANWRTKRKFGKLVRRCRADCAAKANYLFGVEEARVQQTRGRRGADQRAREPEGGDGSRSRTGAAQRARMARMEPPLHQQPSQQPSSQQQPSQQPPSQQPHTDHGFRPMPTANHTRDRPCDLRPKSAAADNVHPSDHVTATPTELPSLAGENVGDMLTTMSDSQAEADTKEVFMEQFDVEDGSQISCGEEPEDDEVEECTDMGHCSQANTTTTQRLSTTAAQQAAMRREQRMEIIRGRRNATEGNARGLERGDSPAAQLPTQGSQTVHRSTSQQGVSPAMGFPTFADLITHLRTSDTRYRAALPAEFCAKNPPPLYLTLYYVVTRLPDSLRVVRDHFLSVCPTTLTVDLLEERLLAAEQSIVAVGASRGDPRTPIFEGCSPSPLLPSVASTTAADLGGFESIGAASTPSGSRRMAGARGAGALVGVAGKVEVVVEVVEGVGVVVGVVVEVEVSAAAVEAAAAVVAAVVAEAEEEAEAAEAVVELVAELHRGVAPVVVSASSSSAVVRPPPLSNFGSGTLGVSEVEVPAPAPTFSVPESALVSSVGACTPPTAASAA
ncbi:unnamed protein product [Closterium sp. NIES-54]